MKKTMWMVMVMCLVGGGVAFGNFIVDLAPAVQGPVANDGTTVNPRGWTQAVYKDDANHSDLVWYYVAEYDLTPYKSLPLVNATLKFYISPLWYIGNDMDCNVAWGNGSDLQITQPDAGRDGDSLWSTYQSTGYVNYSPDVTTYVSQALPGATNTSGIFFGWYSQQALQGNPTFLGYEVLKPTGSTLGQYPVLSLEFVPEPATMILLVAGGILGLVRRK